MISSKPLNVLITQGESYTGQTFARALRKQKKFVIGKLISVSDADRLYIAANCDMKLFNKPFVVPFQGFAQSLELLLDRESIDIAVPTCSDTDAQFLALIKHNKSPKEFSSDEAHPKIAVADLSAVELAMDKWEFYNRFQGGFSLPTTYPVKIYSRNGCVYIESEFFSYRLEEQSLVRERQANPSLYRFVIKPRCLSGGMYYRNLTLEDLADYLKEVGPNLWKLPKFSDDPDINFLMQVPIRGQEIIADSLSDEQKRVVSIVTRKMHKDRNNYSVGNVFSDSNLNVYLSDVLNATEISWFGNIDAILTEQGPVILEVNPRIGGSYGLSHSSGINFPLWMLELFMEGKIQNLRKPRDGTYKQGEYTAVDLIGLPHQTARGYIK